MQCILNFVLVLSLLMGLVCPLSAATEGTPPVAPRFYLGARLSAEIPELLRKHLRIEPGQGLLVENIFRNSPADKAGLDKDDILLTFDGAPLKDARAFYHSLREIENRKTVSITLIHLGQPMEATIAMEALSPDFQGFRLSNASNWKYPLEAEESMIVRPGRMFRKLPGQKDWVEVPLDQFKSTEAKQPDIEAQYHFRHDDGQKKFMVIIAGNPAEPNALITVKTPDKEYFIPAGQLNKLPQEYQQTVRHDIEIARQSDESERNPRFPLQIDPSKLPELSGADSLSLKTRPQGSGQTPDSKIDALTKQIQQLEERQKELETYLKEKLK